MKIEIQLQEKQKKAFLKSLETPVLFYGGARGSGKSYLIRAREVYRRLKHPNTKGLIVRKTYPELLSNHIRMFFKEYPQTKEWFKAGEKTIYWPNGSITEFSYLKSTNDVYTYQGREYEDISIDEITQHEELVFKMLRGSNRTTNENINPTMLLTGNPGGIGHGFVKRIFVDRQFQKNESPKDFAFVQAKVYDNDALMDADPQYLQRLKDLPDALRRAWLEGDWDVFAGQVFSEFRRELHTMKPKIPSSKYPHFLWIDWGYSGRESHDAAFAAYNAVLVKAKHDGQTFNRVVIYKEWAGKFKHPKEWAEKIYNESPIRKIRGGYADPAMFNTQTDGSKPISKLMEEKWRELNGDRNWITLKPGSRNRIGRVATVHNWLSIAPDGLPYMLITESCPYLIKTLPLLVYDAHNVEDVNCFVAGTKVKTLHGDKKIENVKVGEYVDTPIGYRRVVESGISGKSKVCEVEFNNGAVLKGTKDHKIMTNRGLVEMQNLRNSDIIHTWRNIKKIRKLFTKELHTLDGLVGGIMSLMELICLKAIRRYTDRFISTVLEVFQRVCTFITKTMIMMTTLLKTLRSCRQANTLDYTYKKGCKREGLTENGRKQKKEKEYLEKTHGKCMRIHRRENLRASIVRKLLEPGTPQKYYAGVADILKGIIRLIVPSVVRSFFKRKKERIPLKPVRINVGGNLEEEIVYNLTVEEAHLYYANGVLVTNTEGDDHGYDGVSYGLSAIKFLPVGLGGVSPKQRKRAPMPELINALDLSEFERPSGKVTDWRAA